MAETGEEVDIINLCQPLLRFCLLLHGLIFDRCVIRLFQFADIQSLSIPPDTLQIVEESVVPVEDVYNDITVIHKNPVGGLVALHLSAGAAHLAEFLFHVVYHGLNLIGIGTACYNKVIRHDGNAADIDDTDIFAFFVR